MIEGMSNEVRKSRGGGMTVTLLGQGMRVGRGGCQEGCNSSS